MLAEVASGPPAWKAHRGVMLGALVLLSVPSVVADVLATFWRYVGQSCDVTAAAARWEWAATPAPACAAAGKERASIPTATAAARERPGLISA